VVNLTCSKTIIAVASDANLSAFNAPVPIFSCLLQDRFSGGSVLKSDYTVLVNALQEYDNSKNKRRYVRTPRFTRSWLLAYDAGCIGIKIMLGFNATRHLRLKMHLSALAPFL
jgi:hypothetical protein